LAIILLSVLTFGVTIFSFVGETSRFNFNAFGIVETDLVSGKQLSYESFPLYIGTIALTLLCFLAVMAYKSLARQFKLGRTIFGLYFLSVIGIILISMYGKGLIDTPTTGRELGVGFYCLIAGFPFTFLANIGIKRDKSLLESLDRLR
jgi:hypothetical protein